MSERKDQGQPARETRRPAPPRKGFVGWSDYVARWLAVVVFALIALMVAVTLAFSVQLDAALTGGAHRLNAVAYVVVSLGAIATVVLMGVMAVHANAPDRFKLSPHALDVVGTLVFYGMIFSFPLLILSGGAQIGLVLVVAMGAWWIRVRSPLKDELPVTAGGKRPPGKRQRRRRPEDVTSRPPRSWDPNGGSKRSAGPKKKRTTAPKRGKRKH